MKIFKILFVMILVISKAYADNCEEYLNYSDQQRLSAALEVLTNATPTQKITIAILLEKACLGEIPEFSRSEANKDAGALLPYLRSQKSN
jgi:hypothetical protein